MFRNKLTVLTPVLLIGVIGALMLFVFAPAARADLPPRPPVDGDTASTSTSRSEISGAFIELSVSNAPANAWTVVQWRDPYGEWHDVEGWQGTLDGSRLKRWYVGPDELGKGPFRWLVLSGSEGEILGQSQMFMLPQQAGSTTNVAVVATAVADAG